MTDGERRERKRKGARLTDSVCGYLLRPPSGRTCRTSAIADGVLPQLNHLVQDGCTRQDNPDGPGSESGVRASTLGRPVTAGFSAKFKCYREHSRLQLRRRSMRIIVGYCDPALRQADTPWHPGHGTSCTSACKDAIRYDPSRRNSLQRSCYLWTLCETEGWSYRT